MTLKKVIFSIFFFGMILRLAFSLSLPPHFFWSDETGYYNIALNLCDKSGYTNKIILVPQQYHSEVEFNHKDAFCYAPGLPLTLAGIMCIVGNNIIAVRLIHTLITSVLPILAFCICINLFKSRRTACIAAIITAVYPYFVYISSVFYPQAIFGVMLALVLFFFTSWLRDGRNRWLILTGMTNGLACLFVVPMVFTTIPILIITFYRLVIRRVSLLAPAIFLFSWAIIVVPYTIYASCMNNRLVMITKLENVGLHTFNHPDLRSIEILSHKLTLESANKIDQLSDKFKETLDPSMAATRWFIQVLREHPFLIIRNCLLRLFAFFAPITFTVTKNPHTGLVPNLIGIFIYLPLFIMSNIGLLRITRERDWVGLQVISLLLFYMIPHILMIGNTRYRLPWDLLIICFAAYCISSMVVAWIDKLKTTTKMASTGGIEN